MTQLSDFEVIRFSPIKLPYAYKALEPYIDEETMEIHYNKHYLGYLNKINALLEKFDVNEDVISLMQNIDKYPIEIRDNGGGYVNHSLF